MHFQRKALHTAHMSHGQNSFEVVYIGCLYRVG